MTGIALLNSKNLKQHLFLFFKLLLSKNKQQRKNLLYINDVIRQLNKTHPISNKKLHYINSFNAMSILEEMLCFNRSDN